MSKGSDVVVASRPSGGKEDESLFDILQRMEQYGLIERWAGSIPEEAITQITQLHFIEILVKQGFLSTLPLLLTAPLGFAVVKRILPVFGKDHISLSDKIFSLSLSALPSLAVAIIIGLLLSMFYHGELVGKIRNKLIQGYIIGKFAGTFICFVVFNGIYYFILRNNSFYISFRKMFGFTVYNKVAPVLYSMGDAFIDATWFSVGIFILSILIIFAGSKYGQYKSNKYRAYIQKWGLQ